MKLFRTLILTSLLIYCTSCGKSSLNLEEKTQQPNIIFLLADDMRFDMLANNGNNIIHTPNLDKLAIAGTNYTNSYVTTSICSVSRASILSGQYGRRHELWGFGNEFSDSSFQATYPMQLQKNGYHVGFVGKYGVGNITMPASKFDFWRGFAHQGKYRHKDNEGNDLHLTEKIGDQIIEFLDSLPDSNPFCLSVSFKAPHVQDGIPSPEAFQYDQAYESEYETSSWPKPVTSNPIYFDHFPYKPFDEANVARKRFDNRFSTPTKYDQSLEGYYRLVHGLDVQVGRLINELKAKNLDKNTVIIFTSDNGFYLGEYGFAGKWYGSQPSIKTPFLIYDPRHEAGKSEDKVILNIDIAPSILDIAGISSPSSYQGRSILKDNTIIRTKFLYEHLWPILPDYPIPSTEGIVTDRYKYMQYFNGLDNSTIIFEEMYDLESDPNETNNLAEAIEYAELKKRLKIDLSKLLIDAR